MASCVILCAGGFDGLAAPVEKDDYIIAADGGYLHTKALGLTPHCILGDFDSLGFTPEGAQVFPVEKDDTDAMLAVRKGLSLGYKRFVIYGALEGPRLDHTLAACQTLLFLVKEGAQGVLVGKNQTVTTVSNGSLCFPADTRGTLSLFAMGAPVTGVTLEGLYYTLQNGSLSADFPLGVSNHFVGESATVTAEQGTLLVFYDRENGIKWQEKENR